MKIDTFVTPLVGHQINKVGRITNITADLLYTVTFLQGVGDFVLWNKRLHRIDDLKPVTLIPPW